ncbi:hypothetical protein LC065_13365 [Halobacillus litoralis]|uniref:hypothetical protein n=1 Tax=Halobacillus litoralis TaxID=45668 RepID=UPI001CFECEC6|nr:hypothetical protein [Halobacillus litoralis]WLR46556.1 hypothetical protein LC065_13365 [Halobacillus litoralis]
MNVISLLNIINIQECLYNQSFNKNWERYNYYIKDYLGSYPTPSKVLSLGSELSSVFFKSDSERGQSEVAVSGNVWSRLISWYLNISFLGTNCWATNSLNLVPPQLKRALELKMNGEKVSKSKEIIIIQYQGSNNNNVVLPNDLSSVNLKETYKRHYYHFFETINLNELKVILLSPKTAASDMLAIPLFWNFCYKGNQMDNVFDVKVGNSEENPECLIDKKVYYSIVTVPTGKEDKIKKGNIPGNAQINKLQLLDGGFYWGRDSSNKVKSFDNFFQDNFQNTILFGKEVSENYEFIEYPKSIYYKLFNKLV